MGIWTGIKHALNSTLGTENFKPLDKIIEGQKRFVASDDKLVAASGHFGTESNFLSFLKFTPKLDGTLKLQYTAESSNGSLTVPLSVRIYKDGILYDTWSSGIAPNSSSTVDYTLNVQKSSVYEIMGGTSYNVTIPYEFYVGGTIQDSNYFELLS